MREPDLNLQSPQIQSDSSATIQMAALVAKLQDILRDIYMNLQSSPIVTAAPAATEMEEIGDGKGGIISDIKILHHATQSNRKLYYKYQGTVYLLDSA